MALLTQPLEWPWKALIQNRDALREENNNNNNKYKSI